MAEQINKPELWAGIECTINRLHSGYSDQLAFSGHYDRDDDIDAIADLGITTLRYPVLWERHQPEFNMEPDFTWAASNLDKIRARNVNPIIGLVHHGSGPEFTDLLDPNFPELLAAYAKKVATRFPWAEYYTPVNEPLTTARFSGLYGFWYPHKRTESCYVTMLLHQLKATILAMREIRKINPNAKLVQTEDLAKTFSTPLLQYQADKENHRRYFTYDFLCGMVTKSHPCWDYLMTLGISESELQFFIDNPCPPDIIGVNYYCTSERFLDQDVDKYPESRRGGNGMHEYADVEAIRVKFDEPHGFSVLMQELWQRYQIPISVTEAHLHCSREGQIKWFMEIYESACALKQSGIDVRAVTAWSVLGAYGWNKLLMSHDMEYERGTFDVSSGKRRPTAMAGVIRQLVDTGTCNSHVFHGDGWWKSESRFFGTLPVPHKKQKHAISSRPIVIIGKTGTLGKAFANICSQRVLHHILIGRQEADICDALNIQKIIDAYNPWAIINAAGYVRVDDAEHDESTCFRENTTGPEVLAQACSANGIQFMTFSSDLVFDGDKNSPYIESDVVNPINIYGKSKAAAEAAVLNCNPDSLVIRTSAFFGPWDQYNFAFAVIQTLEDGKPFPASSSIISPTYVPHLVNAALDLLIDDEHGIWHLTNNDALTWVQFATAIAQRAGLDSSLILADSEIRPAAQPQNSALISEKGKLMPSLDVALDQYFAEVMIYA